MMVQPNLVPYQNKWLVSYETLLFDTSDGDLDVTQYALDGSGKGYYVRTVPKTQGQFLHIDLSLHDLAGIAYSLTGLTQVKVVPGDHAYYDEFLTAAGQTSAAGFPGIDFQTLPAGSIIRRPSTAALYNPLRTVKDAPQPSRIEQVLVLPPPLSIPLSSEHHSIGFDATSNTGVLQNVTSFSWSHTCGSSANLLVFGFGCYSQAVGRTLSVTYNGSSLTFVRSDDSPTYVEWTDIHFMYAPATGSAKTVSVTLSSSASYAGAGVVSYSGAAQSGQPDAHNGAGATSGYSATVNVTTVADNCWVFSVCSMYYAVLGITCNNQQRWQIQTYSGGCGSDTNGPKHPAGSQQMSWTSGYSYYWSISAASFAPAVAPAVPLSRGLIIG